MIIVTGGSGHLLHLETPVPALDYDNGSTVTTYNATARIELQLEFVPQPPGNLRSARGGMWVDLRIRRPQPAANMAVNVLEVTYTGTQPDDISKSIIKDLFRQWFNDAANLQNFNTVFASVNLNAKADVDAFQWLMPTHVSYAVAEEAGLPDGIFAVLCMTENRSPTGLGHQVSPFAIPAGQRSAFLISRERYLRKLLLPGIGLMFRQPSGGSKRWPEDYFDLSSDGATITNNEEITIHDLEVAEGQTREARIAARNFVVSLVATELAIDITDMKHDYRAGLNWLKVSHTIRTTAAAALREGQKFALEPGDGTHTVVVTKDTTAEWIEIGLITATLLLMTTAMAKGAYRTVTGPVVTGGNTATQTMGVVATGSTPGNVAAQAAAGGASTALGTAAGGTTPAQSVLSAFWQNYRATAMAGMATGISGVVLVLKVLELIAKIDSQHFLPDFNEFAAHVMAPVQWPAASQFEVKAVAFSGSFQAAGDPGFAD